MKKILLLTIILLASLFAQDLDFLFDKANNAYQSENFVEAIKLYENILKDGQISGKLYYNLGNAYYKNDEIGKAILYYEKAKQLMPDNESLLFNLKLANVKVKDRIQMPPDSFVMKLHKTFINIFSLPIWAVIFSSFLLTASILFFLQTLITKMKGKFVQNTIVILIFVAIFTIYPIYSKYSIEELNQKGVLINSYGEVYAAPDGESTKLFNIHEGTLFNILDSDGNWLKIELIDGKQGWLPRNICGEV